MRRRFLSALILVLVCPGLSLAGNYSYCGRACYAAPVHAYAYPTYYPVVHEKVVVKEVQVPYAKPVFLNKDYYFSVSAHYHDRAKDQLIAEAAAYKALLLQAQLLAGQLQGGYQGVQGFSVQPGARLVPPAPGTARPQAPPQTAVPENPVPAGSYDPKLKALVDAKCLKCHNGTKPERINLSDLGNLTAPARAYAHYRVFVSEMPPEDPLTDDEVKLFRDYVSAGKK